VIYYRLLPWDHAPGTLAVTEAGGAAVHLDGSPYAPLSPNQVTIVAASPFVLIPEMSKVRCISMIQASYGPPNYTSKYFTGGSDAITEGTWKWTQGPEAGQTFFLSVPNPNIPGSFINTPVGYASTFFPDNFKVATPGGENQLEIQYGGGWNDQNFDADPSTFGYDGYIIERDYFTDNTTVQTISKAAIMAGVTDPDGDPVTMVQVQRRRAPNVSLMKFVWETVRQGALMAVGAPEPPG